VTAKQVVEVLKATGWQELRQRGSHLQMVDARLDRHTTIPMHKGDLKIGTLKSIERQTGVRLR
jgi:predicted RNA binding protein YcfA (HicA-like mRNA interferase family)